MPAATIATPLIAPNAITPGRTGRQDRAAEKNWGWNRKGLGQKRKTWKAPFYIGVRKPLKIRLSTRI
jgi:hypothetical protein